MLVRRVARKYGGGLRDSVVTMGVPGDVDVKKEVLFLRDFTGFTGGHLKVWDYFNHVLSSSGYVPMIWFSRRSRWDASNPWQNSQQYVLASRTSVNPDVLFLEGMDWLILPEQHREASRIPIINLVQHVRHAWPENRRETPGDPDLL